MKMRSPGAASSRTAARLTTLEPEKVFCVSLNSDGGGAPESVLRRFVYHPPIYTSSRDWAQKAHHTVIRRHRTSFCGAYWGNGFHEDGVVSGLEGRAGTRVTSLATTCRALSLDLR